MRSFADIYATACEHKGGADELERMLPRAMTDAALCENSDAHYLSAMSRRIFRAGLKHAMVDAKWPDFERVFAEFSIQFCAMMSDEFIEQCMSDRSVIRHLGKLKTIRSNAQFIQDMTLVHGSFSQYLTSWPLENTVDLWADLKKQGAHLGGHSGARFLRMVGRDTFLLSDDVVSVLVLEEVVDKAPSSKVDLRKVQGAFNLWHEESGRPLCEISRIVSFTAI